MQLFKAIKNKINKFLTIITDPLMAAGGNSIIYFNTSNTSQDNAMPDFLLELYHKGSPINQRLINTKANMLFGSGIKNDDPKAQAWLDDIGADTLYRKMCQHMALYETFYAKVIPFKGIDAIKTFKLLDPKTIRVGVDEDSEVDKVVYKRDWVMNMIGKRINADENEFPVYSKYDPTSKIAVWIGNDVWREDYYKIPSYYSALNYIQLDLALSRFHLKNVETDFAANQIINFPLLDMISNEERDIFISEFHDFYTGVDSEKTFITFGENYKVEVTPIAASNNVDVYNETARIAEAKIAMAHGFTQELAGIETQQNKLSGDSGGKLRVAREMAITDIIEPMQRIMMEFFNEVARVNGFESDFYVLNTTPLFLQPSDLLTKVLTQDELRLELGFEPMKVGDQSVDAEVEEEIGDNEVEDIEDIEDIETNN
jgi:hypothetical protein